MDVSAPRPVGATPVAAPPGGAAPAAPADTLAQIQADALKLTGQAPAAGGTPAVPMSPNLALAQQRLRADAIAAQQAGNLQRAQVLASYSQLIDAVSTSNPALAGQLAQAYTNPNASFAARRLAQTLLGSDPTPVNCLLGVAAFDGQDGATWRQQFPNSIFGQGISGQQLIGTLVNEITGAQPISQGSRYTCGATVVQILLAREAPGEYIRLVTGLAATGSANLHSGVTITRAQDWNAGTDAARSLSSRLLQPAFMNDASSGNYDNTLDITGGQYGRHQGLVNPEVSHLVQDATDRPVNVTALKRFDRQQSSWVPTADDTDTINAMAQSTSRGMCVPVLMVDRPDLELGHYALVSSVTAQGVQVLDPRGRVQTYTLDQFRSLLVASFLQ